MSALIIRLVMLASLCVASFGYCSAGISEAYKKVDALLREKGSNQQPSVYLDVVDNKLNELRKENKSEEELAEDEDLTDFINALEDVAAYRLVVSDTKCGLADFEILDPVAENSGAHRYIADVEASKLSGLKSLAHTVGLEHAKFCRDKYPKSFEKIYSQLDDGLKLRAEYKIHDIEELEKTMSNKDFAKYLLDYRYDSDAQTASDVSKHLLEMSKDDDNKVKCNFNLIYDKYMLDPCQEYVTQLDQVVVPMKHDAAFFKDDSFLNAEHKSVLNLYKAMALSAACSNLLIFDDLEALVRIQWEINNSKDCEASLTEQLQEKMSGKPRRSLFDLLFGGK